MLQTQHALYWALREGHQEAARVLVEELGYRTISGQSNYLGLKQRSDAVAPKEVLGWLVPLPNFVHCQSPGTGNNALHVVLARLHGDPELLLQYVATLLSHLESWRLAHPNNLGITPLDIAEHLQSPALALVREHRALSLKRAANDAVDTNTVLNGLRREARETVEKHRGSRCVACADIPARVTRLLIHRTGFWTPNSSVIRA